MKYITRRIGTNVATIDSIAGVYRIGDTKPFDSRYEIVGQYVTDYFDEQVHSLVTEELQDFQVDADIDDDTLLPELEAKLTNCIEELKDIIAECKVWQLGHQGWTQLVEK